MSTVACSLELPLPAQRIWAYDPQAQLFQELLQYNGL